MTKHEPIASEFTLCVLDGASFIIIALEGGLTELIGPTFRDTELASNSIYNTLHKKSWSISF